jgi:hypothetical protein
MTAHGEERSFAQMPTQLNGTNISRQLLDQEVGAGKAKFAAAVKRGFGASSLQCCNIPADEHPIMAVIPEMLVI